MIVRPKKYLGQHFLKDENIAQKIVNALTFSGYENLLEIGPGTGVLTKYLLKKEINFAVCELDKESVEYLRKNFPELNKKIIQSDFLQVDFHKMISGYFNNSCEPCKLAIIGNFPYNISSQILFRVLENRDIVTEVVGMFQKEVAQRIASPPGSKDYGILSVLLQAFYNIEYLFTVSEEVFNPPPKVKSGVIRLIRNNVVQLNCDEQLFVKIVKAGFNQRRKTLRNALSAFLNTENKQHEIFSKRAEQLSVEDFVMITNMLKSA
jgi:16S rRNA (adenine1518-N6/adenine1519-N6)-dimethyltransferase